MQMTGYVVGESDKALALVLDRDLKPGVKPLWVPKSKILAKRELDSWSLEIPTDRGLRAGHPVEIEIDPAFLAKVGAA